METLILPVYNMEGKEVGKFNLDVSIFDGEINDAAVYQVINAYRNNQRKGLASTKTRGDVSGGGKKPWKQKGTGRARVGSIRSPLWRHGGVVFGPHPRDFYYTVPQKIRNLALKSSLNAKIKDNNIIVLDDFSLNTSKTKEASKVFINLKVASKVNKKNSVLLLLDKLENNIRRAISNLGFLNFNMARDTHAYEILSHRKIIVTKDGLNNISKRLSK